MKEWKAWEPVEGLFLCGARALGVSHPRIAERLGRQEVAVRAHLVEMKRREDTVPVLMQRGTGRIV